MAKVVEEPFLRDDGCIDDGTEGACRIYATPHGDLPGGVHFPLSTVDTWEWQRRICVPNRFIQQGRHADENVARAAFLRSFVTRTRRFGGHRERCIRFG
eukprot:IDg6188t1